MNKYDKLFEFIPYLKTASYEDAVVWQGSKTSSEGVITLPFPSYNDQIKAFIDTTFKLDILDKEYMTTIRSFGIHNYEQFQDAIHDANCELAIALLTYYVRQERFCDGFWAKAVEEKIFLSIIERLQELQS